MAEDFDPYYRWFGIPPEEQPPHHYRLLAIKLFEDQPDVIETASDQRMMLLHSFQTGKHAAVSQRLLNEVAAAKICLLNAAKKAEYDRALKARLAAVTPRSLAVAQPIEALAETDSAMEELIPAGSAELPWSLLEAPIQTPATAQPTSHFKPESRPVDWRRRVSIAVGAGVALLAGATILWTRLQGQPGSVERPLAAATEATAEPGESTPRETSKEHSPPPPPVVPAVADPTKPVPPSVDPPAKPVVARLEISSDRQGVPRSFSVLGPPPSVSVRPIFPGQQEQAAPSVPATKLPVPSAESQEKLLRQVKEIFEEDAPPSELAKVGKKEIEEGRKSAGNTDEHYVLLRRGCELAAKGGDLDAAVAAADEIGARFEDDALLMRMRAMAWAAAANLKPEDKEYVIHQALPVLDEAVASGKIPEAEKLAALLLTAAERAKRGDFIGQLKRCQKTIKTAASQYQEFQDALGVLKDKPDDPDANLTTGRYQCFVQKKWKDGLPMLAKGSDEALKQLAQQEVGEPQDGEAQMKLADGWYGYAQNAPEAERALFLDRAKQWYEQCRSNLTSGLKQARVDKRLAEIGKASTTAAATGERPKPAATISTSTRARKARIVACGRYSFEMYVNGRSFLSGRGYEASQAECELAPGDVITVKCEGSSYSSTSLGFACVIGFEPPTVAKGRKPIAPLIVATGPNCAWRSYQPRNTAEWYLPENVGTASPFFASVANVYRYVTEASTVRCASIWGSSTGMTCYLMLKIEKVDPGKGK